MRIRSSEKEAPRAMAPGPDGQDGRERPALISNGLPSQLPDIDPAETAEWLESLDAVVEHVGRNRARFLMLSLL
jgi:pyruvate dehydrogenase E1 component